MWLFEKQDKRFFDHVLYTYKKKQITINEKEKKTRRLDNVDLRAVTLFGHINFSAVKVPVSLFSPCFANQKFIFNFLRINQNNYK